MNHPHNLIFLRFSKRAEASLHRLLRGVERSEDTGDSPSLQTISPDDLYRSLTALLLRILFLLYAEERALLPTDNPYYQNNHSLIGSVREEEPYAVYQRLRTLFHILYCGIEHPKLSIKPKGSPLFDPNTHPVLERNIDNDTIRDVLSILKNHDDVPIDFKTLPIECIGSVYEHLLSFTLIRENSHFEIISKGERKKFGTHYTPPSLCNFIVEQTLGAAVRDLRTPSELLSLRVCDPAMGSGAFLLSACRFLYQFAQTQFPSVNTSSLRFRLAEQCLYGVDLNPTATYLAQLSLWLECAEPSQPFSFLSHNLRAGNSLIGARRHHLSSFSFTSETEHAPRSSPERLSVLADWLVSLRYAIYFGGKNGKKRGKVDARNLVARETKAAKRYLYQQADVPPASQRLMEQLPLAPFHWELAFPEVFCAPRKGFDAVIGNPPFVNCIRGNISDEVKTLLKERYPDIRGSADLSYYFLYLASELTH
ncbi:MAG: N-6 DNA methylase, partial [Myxococcota bacterium]|nr:N-6 DNA methylase [Myxococcota bacterium]